MIFAVADRNLYLYLHSFAGQSTAVDNLIVFFAVTLPYLLAALAVAYVLFSENRRAEKILTFISAGFTILLARFAIGSSLRFIFLRPRPMLALHLTSLFPEISYSFPSGHALVLFSATGIIYFYNKRLGLFFGVGSALVGIARVMAGVHYPSDIIGGALIGLLVAYVVERFAIPYFRRIPYFKAVEKVI